MEEDVGRRDAAAATRARREMKEAALTLLRIVTRVAEVASRENPDLAGRFEPPKRRSSAAAFSTRARAMMDLARANVEVLTAHGLVAAKLDELDSALGRFEAETGRIGVHRRAHVGARAKLLEVTREMMELLALLDALNRARFKDDAKGLAAWDSARNVIGPARSKPVELVEPAEPVQPECGDSPAPPDATLGDAA